MYNNSTGHRRMRVTCTPLKATGGCGDPLSATACPTRLPVRAALHATTTCRAHNSNSTTCLPLREMYICEQNINLQTTTMQAQAEFSMCSAFGYSHSHSLL